MPLCVLDFQWKAVHIYGEPNSRRIRNHEDAGMGHAGWMVMHTAGSRQMIIEFVVPLDAVGEWEMGCFEDDGTHYEDGMQGTITVVAP